MIVTNETGEDVSSLYLQLMKGEITNDTFEKLSGLTPIAEDTVELKEPCGVDGCEEYPAEGHDFCQFHEENLPF